MDKEVTKDEWVVLRGKAGLLGKVTSPLSPYPFARPCPVLAQIVPMQVYQRD